MSEIVEKIKKKHIPRKIVIYTFSAWASFELVFLLLATPLLKSRIQEIITRESKGVYNVDFKYISVEPITLSFRISGFTLTADTAKYNLLKNTNNVKAALYEIEFKDLILRNLNLFELFYENKVKFKKIELNSPTVNILALPLNFVDNDKYDAVHNDLYASLKPYANALSVSKIALNNGHFNLQLNHSDKDSKSVAEEITVLLYNFNLDSIAYYNKPKLFYSDSLSFIVNNYKLSLNDGIHIVTAEQAFISLADSTIRVKNTHIFPDSAYALGNANKIVYDIKAPKVVIKGADIQDAWFNKRVSISNLNFDSAVIKIVAPYEKIDTITKINIERQDFKNFFPLIKGRLNSVEVADFNYTNSSFFFYKGSLTNKPMYKIDELNFSLQNFLLDSLAYTQNDKILYSDNFEMEVNNYMMKTADENHYITADNLFLSTQKKKNYAVNIKILPVDRYDTADIKIDLNIPVIMLGGADFIKAYNTGELNISELTAQNPTVIINKTNFGKKNNNANPNIIYDLVSFYLNKVTIEKFSFFNGLLNYKEIHPDNKNAFFQGKISLTLSNFLLDENTAKSSDRVFYADNFDISLRDFMMKTSNDLHVIKLGKVNASTYNSSLQISNFEYMPSQDSMHIKLLKKYKKESIYYFRISKLSFKNIDIKKAIFRKELNIGEIYMQNPYLKINNYKGLIGKNYNDTSILENIFVNVAKDSVINEIAIDQNGFSNKTAEKDSVSNLRRIILNNFSGKLNQIYINKFTADSAFVDIANFDSLSVLKNYFSSNIYAYVDSFYYNKDSVYLDKPIFAGNTKIVFSNFNTLLSTKNHKVKINKITYDNTDSSLLAEYVKIFPDTNVNIESIKSGCYFYSPYMKFSGINIESVISNKKFDINKVHVKKPFLSFIDNKDIEKIKNNAGNNAKMTMKSINAKVILVENGHLSLISSAQGKETEFAKMDFDFFAQNLSVDTLANKEMLPVTYQNATLTLKNIDFYLPDSTYAIRIDSVSFLAHNKDVAIFNLKYFQRPDKDIYEYFKKYDKNSVNEISVDSIKFHNINLSKLVQSKRLIINGLDIYEPEIIITKYFNKKNKKNFNFAEFETGFKNKTLKNLNEILISHTQIHKLNFSSGNRIPGRDELIISNLKINIEDFNINKFETPDQRIFFASDISAELPYYSYNFDKQKYFLKLKKISFSTKKQALSIDSISYLPTKNKYYYAHRLGKQKSVLFLNNSSIAFENIDFRRFIDKKEVFAKTLKVSNADLYIFKDMHPKEDTLKRPEEPWLLLKKIKSNVYISKITLNNSILEYEQNSNKFNKTGSLVITDIQGTITNITNDSAALLNNNIMRAKITARFQDEAIMKVSFKFPLNDTTGTYSFAGTVDTLNLRSLNSYVENTVFVSVKDGILNKLTFYVDVNNKFAEGKMHMFYKDLSVRIIDTTASSKGLFTFFANTVLPGNNPKRKYGKIREGKIYTEKIEYKPVFNLWVKSIISGASSTVGFKSKEMKKHLKLSKRIQKLLKKNDREKTKTQKKTLKELNNQ